MTPNQPAQEQISFEDILQKYRERTSELEHALIIMECRVKNKDEQIEALLRERDTNALPDTPHR